MADETVLIRPNIGRFENESEALDAVVRRIVDDIEPEEIWLFGSRAASTHRPDSDFDLLVVTRVEDGDAGYDYERVYRPILGTGVGCDVVPCRADDFLRESTRSTGLIHEVLGSGVRLYEKRQSGIIDGPRSGGSRISGTEDNVTTPRGLPSRTSR